MKSLDLYKKMYCILLEAIDCVLFELPPEHPAAVKLQSAVYEAEELFIVQSGNSDDE